MTPEQKATAVLIAAAREAWHHKLAASKERDAEQFHSRIMGAKRLAEATESRTSEVNEAVRQATVTAEASACLGVAALQKMRAQRLERCAGLQRRLEELASAKQGTRSSMDTLRHKLGEAIVERGISTNALFREWDKNGDGELSKSEFVRAMRLSLTLNATAEQRTLPFHPPIRP
jgi:hypothetical protein